MRAADAPALHDTGTGSVVLMLHAFPLDASQWDHQVAHLSGSFRCVRPDMWGCGESAPPPGGAPSLDAYADSVLNALDDAGIDRFVAVGSSAGGYITFALWRRAPGRIAAMVLCGTRAGADSEERRADRERQAQDVLQRGDVEEVAQRQPPLLVAPAHGAEAHLMDPLRGRVRRCSPGGVAYALRAMAARPDSSAQLGSMDVPTLVVAGLEDQVIAIDEMRRMAAALPQAELVEMQGCGHLPNLEDPPAFSASLERFLGAAVSG